jgi:integrase
MLTGCAGLSGRSRRSGLDQHPPAHLTRLCREVGIGRSESGATPRVHDLRHSFAVATLLHWYPAGINPTGKLLQLSTFLGHSKIKATAVYLTITWELLHEAKQRFAQVAAAAIPEVAS